MSVRPVEVLQLSVTNVAKTENEWDSYFQEPWTPGITPPSPKLYCVCASHFSLSPSLSPLLPLSFSLSLSLSLFVCLSLIDLSDALPNALLPSRQIQCLSSPILLLLIRRSPSVLLRFLSLSFCGLKGVLCLSLSPFFLTLFLSFSLRISGSKK